MYIKNQLNDQSARPCPFCGSVRILVSDVQFEKADDEGYKILCDCGWAGRQLRGWYSNKTKLIEKWNELIQEGEFTECQTQL